MADEQSKSTRGISIPGQPTEEAIAEVGSEAGKSLLRGLGKLGSASVEHWIATKEARAAAAKLAIETESKIAAENAVVSARRDYELKELEHQSLLQRRANRLRIELQREQENLESIERKAIEYTESDPENKQAQEIDVDWLFQFADAAQRVSNETVQTLWARVLSSAAIAGGHLLSAQALQTLSMFDQLTAQDFQKLTFVVARLGFFPVLDSNPPLSQVDPQHINIPTLVDLNLIHQEPNTTPYNFRDFLVESGVGGPLGLALFKDRIFFTKRGADIANAVFRGSTFSPGNHLIGEYLRLIVQREILHNHGATVFTKAGTSFRKSFVLRSKTSRPQDDLRSLELYQALSSELKDLLSWALLHYDVEVVN